MARGIKRRVTLALSVLAGFALLGFILYTTGLDAIWAQIVRLGAWGALLLFLDVSLMVVGWIWSWKLLLNAYGLFPSWCVMFRAIVGGYALSYLTPSMYFGGEPLRVYLVAKELGASSSQVTATVVVAKVLEGATLMTLVLIGVVNLILSGVLGGGQEASLLITTLALLGALAWLAWGLFNRRFWASRFCAWLERTLPWGKERLERLRHWLTEAELDVHQAFTEHTAAMIKALVIALLTNLTVFIRPWIFFHFTNDIAFGFKDLSLVYALFFFLSSFMWVTPGGIGVSEGGLIGIFQFLGVGAAGAVAYSLALKGMELLYVLCGVFILVHFGLLRLPKPKPDVASEVDEASEEHV